MAKTLSATIGLLFLVAFIAAFGLSGCEKTITVTENHYDTIIVEKPIEVPRGPAYIRFVSMLPDRNAAGIVLYRGPSESSVPFGLASDQSRNEFIPVLPKRALTLYAFYYRNMVKVMDSIVIPPFEPTEMYTCAIFSIDDPGNGTAQLSPRFAWDSLKVVPAAEGKAYLRLINGLSDYPTPVNEVNLKLQSITSPTLFPEPIRFSNIGNYVEVPVGNYSVFVTATDEPGSVFNKFGNFAQGGYYTAMVYGIKGDGSADFRITTEN